MILVGPDEKRFELPQNLICKYSPFFSRGFEGRSQEATDGVLLLPEDNADLFANVAYWLFGKKLMLSNTMFGLASSDYQKRFRRTLQLYYLVDKLGIVDLLDDIIALLTRLQNSLLHPNKWD